MTEVATQTNYDSWLQTTWRPASAWMYLCVCVCDFILFPIGNAILGASHNVFTEWKPLTIQGGGIFHLAMGAIVGVTSWQRSQEKMATMRMYGGSYSESVHTETTVQKAEPVVAPAKVDIKTDTVQVNTNPSSRAD